MYIGLFDYIHRIYLILVYFSYKFYYTRTLVTNNLIVVTKFVIFKDILFIYLILLNYDNIKIPITVISKLINNLILNQIFSN